MVSEPATAHAPDWEKVEAEYRAGALSVRQIAKLNGVSHTAIQKRAKAASPPWTRNLAGKVRERVAERLVAAVATAKTQERAVEQAAEASVLVILNHRRDIQQLRARRDRLLKHLDDALSPPKPKGKGAKTARVVEPLDASAHATILERISRIEGRIQTLERAAWGLTIADAGGGDGVPADSDNDDDSPVRTVIELPANGR